MRALGGAGDEKNYHTHAHRTHTHTHTHAHVHAPPHSVYTYLKPPLLKNNARQFYVGL